MSPISAQLPRSLGQYPKLLAGLASCSAADQATRLRHLAQHDLYFLLRYLLNRRDLEHPWLFARCREVQAAPDGFVDLWAREHYKSTIITFGLTIQNLLCDGELTVGIFSHTRPIARAFLRQIRHEFEANTRLQHLFPDILWAAPRREAPKWSEEDGITLKRQGNPKEASLEAWGLVDGQPTGRHFRLLVYDDVVTRESVSSPEMIRKVTEAWELSRNLAAAGGATRTIGTRYHFADTYAEMIKRGVTARIYPATADGRPGGRPVLMSPQRLAAKRREMGPYTFGCQMLQNPRAEADQSFRLEWLRYHDGIAADAPLHVYAVIDPASSKKTAADYTAGWVIGLAADRCYYVLDAVRARLNLTERADLVFAWQRRFRPRAVGYERYGLMADIEHIKDRQARDAMRFRLIELGGRMAKADRIRQLVPVFEAGRVLLPRSLPVTDAAGRSRDLVQDFVTDEYTAFPVAKHDDMLDALARILDPALGAVFPTGDAPEPSPRNRRRSWMAG